MPRIDDYQCPCGETFEAMKMTSDEVVTCPACGESVAEALMGAHHVFHVIVPSYVGSIKHKAGSIHRFTNRPAERSYVSMPRAKGD